MKKVISAQQHDVVNIENVDPEKVYIVQGKTICNRSFWILRYEKEGWIFRYTDSSAGMSGHYVKMKEAITRAMHYGDIYEFENHEEAFKFVLDTKKAS
jgi:hypothetical protein